MDRVLKAARASGSLNLSNRSLKLVTDIKINLNYNLYTVCLPAC